MSVLIKTVDLPSRCIKCFAMHKPMPGKPCLPQCGIKQRHILDVSVRQDWCPLEEVNDD